MTTRFNILFVLLLVACSVPAQSLKELYRHAKTSFNNSELDSAAMYAAELGKEAALLDSTKYLIKANFLRASIFEAKNNTGPAFSLLFETLKLCKEKKDEANEAATLNKIAILYFGQKSYAEAARYFEEEINLKEKSGNKIHVANSLINLSMLYRRQLQFEKSFGHLQKARVIVESEPDPVLRANYYNGLASYYFNLFTYRNHINAYGNDETIWDRAQESTNLRDSAERYWKLSLALWKELKEPTSSVNPLFNLGYAYQTKKEYTQALQRYLAAKQIVDSLDLPIEKATLYGNLAEVYYDMKDFKLSSDYLRMCAELKDSLQKNEIREYNLKLGKQYELETNRELKQQAQALQLKNVELAEQRKQIYIFILLFILLALLVIVIVVYLNFNKRLERKVQEAKEKFFTNVMHEIRTPLSMIQAPLKTLKPKVQDEEGKYYISLAEKNVTRLNELVNQMLDISKIETNAYRLTLATGSVTGFFEEILASFEKTAIEKNITFIHEVNVPQGLLLFDKDALEKIVTNLVSNAIKYTPSRGSVGLMVQAEEQEQVTNLLIEVWDTGIGIPASEQPKIFERFFRSTSSQHQAQGIGIGLSLVKDIVAAYKGKISFTSEEKKGTRFMVQLPLKHSEQPSVPIEASTPSEDKPLLLLVEDDEDVLEFVTGYLKKHEYEIATARNGNIAKALLKNITPDLIVTDLMMDELDGLSFIKEIKGNKGLNHIPVIVLSAKSSAETRVEVLNAGAQAFLAKPFLPEELNSVIGNQLSLIRKIKSEFKSRIEDKKPGLTAEQKFTSSEPYTQKLFDLIFKNLDNPELSVESLAEMMATNRSHFQRKIKSLTGYSPSELIKFIRLEKSLEFLLAKKGNITEVAYMCGFSSQSYFTKCFTQYFGHSPTQSISQ